MKKGTIVERNCISTQLGHICRRNCISTQLGHIFRRNCISRKLVHICRRNCISTQLVHICRRNCFSTQLGFDGQTNACATTFVFVLLTYLYCFCRATDFQCTLMAMNENSLGPIPQIFFALGDTYLPTYLEPCHASAILT